MPKSTTAFIATIVVLYAAIGVNATMPEATCYYKKQKCCYSYSACGYVPKKLEKKEECPYRKCDDVYKTECYAVPKCEYKKEQDGEDCKEEVDHSGYGAVKKCYPKYVDKEYCVNENKCEQKKYTKCYDVAAYCTKYYYYEYAKYCTTLSCDKLYVDSGSTEDPGTYVETDGELLQVEDGKRINAED